MSSRITRALETAHPAAFSAYAIVAAFSTYFCMYAFRKPFAVATFEGGVDVPLLGAMDLKILFILSQLLGYALSKFLGIKVISEMDGARRAWALMAAIGFAHLALLLFAVVPAPWNAILLFFNGLPLGMVWGLTFGFLEGRRTSEALGAGLSASYIVASGFVKSAGKLVMGWGVSEYWMPFVTGLLFLPFLGLFVFLLAQLPPPSAEDERLRTRRAPMNAARRREFFFRYLPGLLSLTVLYILLTAYRDFRDNFARELWDALGYADAPAVFALSELPIAFGVMVALGVLMAIKDNRRALVAVHVVMLGGTALVGLSTLAFQLGWLPGAWWMVTVGLGLYLAYVPYGCVLFDRMLAAIGFVGTAGFLIYVTDAMGYAGSVALNLYRTFGQPDLSWLDFFIGASYATAVVCTALYLVSTLYFAWVTRREHTVAGGPVPER